MSLTNEERLKRLRALLSLTTDPATRARIEAQILALEAQVPAARAEPPDPSGLDPRDENWHTIKDLVAASYRFVPLNKTIVPPEHTDVRLDVPLAGGGSATLEVTWGIETPLLIGQTRLEGSNEVVPLAIGRGGKRWVIPGATLRGLVRSSLEILAFARLRQVNDHFRFGVRDFTHQLYRDASPVGKDGLVRAGWLKKDGDDFTVTPCARDGDDWGYVEIAALNGGADVKDWSKKNRAKKLELAAAGASGFIATASRALPDGTAGRMIYRPAEPPNRPGELVVSGKAVGTKRYEYVFFRDAGVRPTTLGKVAWRQFELMNCRQGRRGLEPDGAWKELKETKIDHDQEVPVFWVGHLNTQAEGFAFGLTRLFKIPHALSVGDKIPDEHKPRLRQDGSDHPRPEVDFVENLFGYVYERDELSRMGDPNRVLAAAAHKSRIAFGFAKPVDTAAFELWPRQNEHPHQTIMMAPRASYAPYYLTGREKDWSSPASRLAGRKRYPPRYNPASLGSAKRELEERLKDPLDRYKAGDRFHREAPASVRTRLRFLSPVSEDAAFASSIRMHNVTKVELGALLWALTFGGDTNGLYRHMLGRAKGMGAGQCAVRNVAVTWRPYVGTKRCFSWSQNQADPEATEFMNAFLNYMETKTAGTWLTSETVQDYLGLHSTATWAHLAGRLAEALGALPAGAAEATRVMTRRAGDGALGTSFLARPNPTDHKARPTNDFQKIRAATKLGHTGLAAPDANMPDRLLKLV
jgi:CRISPR-associated protein (TIGR03986 family)